MNERENLDTGTQDLIGWIEDGVAVLSFNRPDRRNALSNAMYSGFGKALPVVQQRSDIRCLVVTGEGGAFCAGGDVKGFVENNEATSSSGKAPSPEPRIDGLRHLQASVSLAISRLSIPSVAVLPGAAAGAGLSIALACDLRVAVAGAKLTTAFAKIGASGDFGGSWFLTQLVGPAKAKELYLTSPVLTAEEAAAIGIVNVVLPKDSFEEGWRTYARELAQGPSLAYRYMLENIDRAASGASLASCLDAEASAMVQTMSSADHKEAALAFVEKRRPSFSGE